MARLKKSQRPSLLVSGATDVFQPLEISKRLAVAASLLHVVFRRLADVA